ncbi:conserved hypothetical protein [Ricinus communis]|uniref:Uncharacterized protein n=1 Tax=Ricinus communis TaxID=3988 RepID=B9SX59_RICCO|nr:conserved hypothetical protein [Ricinus communis]
MVAMKAKAAPAYATVFKICAGSFVLGLHIKILLNEETYPRIVLPAAKSRKIFVLRERGWLPLPSHAVNKVTNTWDAIRRDDSIIFGRSITSNNMSVT